MIGIRYVKVNCLFHEALTKHIPIKIHIALWIMSHCCNMMQTFNWIHFFLLQLTLNVKKSYHAFYCIECQKTSRDCQVLWWIFHSNTICASFSHVVADKTGR